jgi:hypothetical protein
MQKFHTFLESLKTDNNDSLIESIHWGYFVCAEAQSEADLTWKERNEMRRWLDKELRKPGINELKYPLDVAIPERNAYIPPKGKPRRKPKYGDTPRNKELWQKAKDAYGGDAKINRENNWKNVQIYYNRLATSI